MNVAETLYRLPEYVQLSIFVRDGVDAFEIHHATVEVGPYTKFLTITNVGSQEPRFLGRVIFQFNPLDLGWDNTQINYIKIAPVVAGVPGALEGPTKIYPLHYDQTQATNNKSALFVFDETDQRWIPASTNMSAFQ